MEHLPNLTGTDAAYDPENSRKEMKLGLLKMMNIKMDPKKLK